jgi:23S rRNA pseudouridine2605 synthase
MLAKIGHKVRDLTRVRMGPLTLQGLDPGEVRTLTAREIKELKNLAKKGEGELRSRRDAEDE